MQKIYINYEYMCVCVRACMHACLYFVWELYMQWYTIYVQEKLKSLREEYLQRKSDFSEMFDVPHQAMIVADLQADLIYLQSAYIASSEAYMKLLQMQNAGAEKLKAAAWECTEFLELLQVC